MKSPTLAFALTSLLATSAPALAQNHKSNAVNPTTPRVLTEVPVRDLNKNPGRFAGAEVTVTGTVNRIEGPGAFIVEGPGLLNNKILVVIQKPQQVEGSVQQPGTVIPVIKEKEHIQLTGRLEEVGITRIERSYSPLKSEIKAEFEGNMPVLIVPPSGIRVVG